MHDKTATIVTATSAAVKVSVGSIMRWLLTPEKEMEKIRERERARERERERRRRWSAHTALRQTNKGDPSVVDVGQQQAKANDQGEREKERKREGRGKGEKMGCSDE